jgi:hypothetical protein
LKNGKNVELSSNEKRLKRKMKEVQSPKNLWKKGFSKKKFEQKIVEFLKLTEPMFHFISKN